MFEDEGIEVYLVICPILPINTRLNELYPIDEYLGQKGKVLQNGEVYSGDWRARLLTKLKRRLPKWLHLIHDFMFLDSYVSDLASKQFQDILEIEKPDIVVVEYVILSKMLDGISKDVLKLIDTHDRFSGRNKRIRASESAGLWWNLSKGQEKRGLSRADLVIAIQCQEAAFFEATLKNCETKVITLDVISPVSRLSPIIKNSYTVGFIGSNNSHNEQGLRSFLAGHWERLTKAVPNIRLFVAGSKFSSVCLEKYPAVKFLGNMEDLGPFYDECSVIINPCLAGSGLKIKSVEALSYGKPLVTTPKGAEGLTDSPGNGLFIHELDSHEFGSVLIRLLNKTDSLEISSKHAIEYITNKNIHSRKKLSWALFNELKGKSENV